MKFLAYVDFLSSNFSLTYNGQKNFQTKFGGFLNILGLAVLLVLFFLFGRDCYLRTNPRVTLSRTLPEKYFNTTLDHSNFTFAFRVEDLDANIVDRPDFFFFEIHYVRYRRAPNGTNIKFDDLLPYYKCKEDEVKDENFNKYHLGNYYCFNNTNVMLGGLWDSENINYIKLKLKNCQAQKDVSKCSKNETEFLNFFKNYLYFGIYYQTFYMDPSEYENPFKKQIVYYYETVDTYLIKKLYYYFKIGEVQDDKGWIFAESTSNRIAGLDRRSTDFLTLQGTDDIKTHTYYEINIYFDKAIETYSRSFQKIQEVAGNLGGIFKFLSIFLAVLLTSYNNHWSSLFLINSFFKTRKHECQNSSPQPKLAINNVPLYDREITSHNNKSTSFIELTTSHKKTNNYINTTKAQRPSFDHLPKERKRFTYGFLRAFICCRGKHERDFVYTSGKEIINKRLDVMYLLNFYNQQQKMMRLMLKDYQIAALDFMSNPNLVNKDKDYILRVDEMSDISKFKMLVSLPEECEGVDKMILERITTLN